MVVINSVVANGKPCEGVSVRWEGGQFVVIAAKKGLLACSAISKEVMEEFELAVAIAKGTKDKPLITPEDLLKANVVDATSKAKELGIMVGEKGQEALKKLV